MKEKVINVGKISQSSEIMGKTVDCYVSSCERSECAFERRIQSGILLSARVRTLIDQSDLG